MKKLAILLSVIGISAVAPFATASEDGIDLMPRVEGVEITHYVQDAAAPARSEDDAFYSRGTGGLSPQ
jgi:hypothetical protein